MNREVALPYYANACGLTFFSPSVSRSNHNHHNSNNGPQKATHAQRAARAPRRPSTHRFPLPPVLFAHALTHTDFDPEALDHEFSASEDSGDTGSEGEETADSKAREHYLPVGKSALRAAKKEGLTPLGPKYEGARVSREKLYESDDEEEDGGVGIEDVEEGDIRYGAGSGEEDDEIDSEDALGSDEERFAGWGFKGSRTTEGGVVPRRGDRVVGSSDEEEGEHDEDEEDEEDDGEDGVETDDSNESQSGQSDQGSDEEEDEDDSDEDDDEARKTLSKMMAEEKKYLSAPSSSHGSNLN
jgi:protein AATF/BFR2